MDFQKHNLILTVIENLRKNGSRTGKTHVQKTLFLLDAAKEADTGFAFVLYKHGPYSFDIEFELQRMRSYAAIGSSPMSDGYGVMLEPGQNAVIVKRAASLSQQQEQAIDRMCTFVGDKNVTELERLATAVWIRTRESLTDTKQVAERLHELKPHVSMADALNADAEATLLLNRGVA